MVKEHVFTDEIVCPYCYEEYTDSWEHIDCGSGENKCIQCGEVFHLEISIDVSYSTNLLKRRK